MQQNVSLTSANGGNRNGALILSTLAALKSGPGGNQSGSLRASRFQKASRGDDGDETEPIAAAGRVRRRIQRQVVSIGAEVVLARAGQTTTGTAVLLN